MNILLYLGKIIKETIHIITVKGLIIISGHESLEFAGLAGELLLQNGAETSRVEDTVNRICDRAGITETEVMVFPTGIIINGKFNGARLTKAKRIYERGTNMMVVSAVNDISRKFADGKLGLTEGMAQILNLKNNTPEFSKFLILFAGSFASGAATILLGGSWADFFPSILATAVVRITIGVTAFNLAYVLQHYLAGLLAALIGILFVNMGFGEHLDKIIIGALLPLVPGVAITNAVRDFISGDLLSGTLRMVEALLIAAALAGGVGFGLTV